MKNLFSGTQCGGFQFLLILDLWDIMFHAVVVFGLGKNVLSKSVLEHCVHFVFCTLCKITDNIVWCVCLKRRRSHFFTEKKGRGPDRQSQKRQQTIEQSDNDYQKILVFHINLIWNFPSKSYCLPNVLPFTMGEKYFWIAFLHTINFMTWMFLTARLLS